MTGRRRAGPQPFAEWIAREERRLSEPRRNGGIAGFQAKRAVIGGDIGAAFINTPITPSGHPYRSMVMPFGASSFRSTRRRVAQRAHNIEAIRYGCEALLIEREAIEESFARAGGLGFGEVLGIGGKDVLRRRSDRLRHGGERLIILGT